MTFPRNTGTVPALTAALTFGGSVGLLTTLCTASVISHSQLTSDGHKRHRQPEYNTGGANPTPIPEISVPLVQNGEMLQCIIVPGVWFVFWTPGAVQATGMGAVWLSDSHRGGQVGKALENENRSRKQLPQREESRTFKSQHCHDHQNLGFQGWQS